MSFCGRTSDHAQEVDAQDTYTELLVVVILELHKMCNSERFKHRPELSKGVITGQYGLLTFPSANTDTNVCSCKGQTQGECDELLMMFATSQ